MKKTTFLTYAFLISVFTFFSFTENNPINFMVKVEGGTFKMGSKDSDNAADIDEQKEHSVTVSDFEISKFEVTVWEWKEYVDANKLKMPKTPTWGWKDNFPINNITWKEAVDFCNWLSKKNNLKPVYSKKGPNYHCDFNLNGFRLPTEAEWEYASKGGNKAETTRYSGSHDANTHAWYKDNSNGAPHMVGTKLPNELGIHDMSGNVWEWCWDWYNEDYYKQEKGNDPRGPIMGERRSVRGGSWDSKIHYLRPANRISTLPSKTHEFYGFRVARSITE